jgi:hypothetical protein
MYHVTRMLNSACNSTKVILQQGSAQLSAEGIAGHGFFRASRSLHVPRVPRRLLVSLPNVFGRS